MRELEALLFGILCKFFKRIDSRPWGLRAQAASSIEHTCTAR